MKTRKRFGQHFLEPAWVTKVVDAVHPAPRETFLEIGPGRGALTRQLAPRAGRIVAVEIDRDLVDLLTAEQIPNLRIVSGDFLEVDLVEVLRDEQLPMRVVGNLPYNVSSPILLKLLASHDGGTRFSDATLMLQREVAERLVAEPGGGDYGPLAIQTRLHADAERVLTLPPGAFRPAPKVTSAVVHLRFRPSIVDVGDPAFFAWLVRGIFTQRRKTLLNGLKPLVTLDTKQLRQILDLERLDPGRRPETLTLEELGRLALAVRPTGPSPVLYFPGSR